MLLIVLVFVGVFLVVALLVAATGTGASEREKQALARLNAVLATKRDDTQDELLDIEKQELLSAIPLLNRILLQLEIAPKLRRLLYQAQLTWTPGGLLLMSVCIWILGTYLVYLRTGVFLVSAILGLIPAGAPFAFLFYKRGKQFAKFEEGLPSALDLMVSGLRGGHSLVSVLGLVAKEVADPIGREFRIAFDEQNYGLELRTALQNLVTRMPIQDLRIMITAILIQKETGGNLAEVLDKCAHVIRERFRLKREIKTKTAQGRLTGWILSFLPVVLGILLFMVNPQGISLLWTKPMGLHMLYGSAVMTIIGGLIIRKIVNIRV
jgi:tight adherence protein B